MPKNITRYDLLISCPGDIKDELKIIEQCVSRFNELYGNTLNISIITRHWSKSSYSQSGDKPQNILNKQFVNDCDAAVALFWTRFGTPTDEYGSGTEEEICKMLDAGKQVFMYFSDVPISPSTMETEQYKQILSFREKYKDKGLYFCYSSVKDFEELFFAHLSKYFLSIDTVSEVLDKAKPDLKIKSIGENYSLMNSLLIKKFILPHRSVEDYTKTIDFLFNSINNRHLDKSITNENSALGALSVFVLGEEAKIGDADCSVIDTYSVQNNIDIADDFFEFGNLRKRNKLSVPASYELVGTNEEKEKYALVEKLADEINELSKWEKVEQCFSNLYCLEIALVNEGTAFDEDIEITLEIPKDSFILPGSLVKLDNDTMGYMLNDCDIYSLFGINSTPDYLDYFSSQKNHVYPARTPYIPALGYSPNYKSDFFDEYNDAFLYDLYEQDENIVLKVNFDYIKQHTTIAFPSVLFVKEKIGIIKYTIKSKNNPDVVEGVIEV